MLPHLTFTATKTHPWRLGMGLIEPQSPGKQASGNESQTESPGDLKGMNHGALERLHGLAKKLSRMLGLIDAQCLRYYGREIAQGTPDRKNRIRTLGSPV